MEKGFIFFLFILSFSKPLYATETNFYFGMGLGKAKMSVVENDIKTGLNIIEGGVVKTSETNLYSYDDMNSFSYNFVTGYSFNTDTSLELGIYDLGEIDLEKFTEKQFSDGSSSSFVSSAKLSAFSLTLSGLRKFPITRDTSINFSLGGAWTSQKLKQIDQVIKFEIINNVARATLAPEFTEKKKDYFNFIYGLGASYKLSKTFDTRANIKSIELDSGSRIIVWSLSLLYKL